MFRFVYLVTLRHVWSWIVARRRWAPGRRIGTLSFHLQSTMTSQPTSSTGQYRYLKKRASIQLKNSLWLQYDDYIFTFKGPAICLNMTLLCCQDCSVLGQMSRTAPGSSGCLSPGPQMTHQPGTGANTVLYSLQSLADKIPLLKCKGTFFENSELEEQKKSSWIFVIFILLFQLRLWACLISALFSDICILLADLAPGGHP